jgi:hypothetical protein
MYLFITGMSAQPSLLSANCARTIRGRALVTPPDLAKDQDVASARDSLLTVRLIFCFRFLIILLHKFSSTAKFEVGSIYRLTTNFKPAAGIPGRKEAMTTYALRAMARHSGPLPEVHLLLSLYAWTLVVLRLLHFSTCAFLAIFFHLLGLARNICTFVAFQRIFSKRRRIRDVVYRRWWKLETKQIGLIAPCTM